jgi:hypothetical protein
MAPDATFQLSKHVASLRGKALELLQEMTRRGYSRDAELSIAVGGMQRVTNELGDVERTMRSVASASPADTGPGAEAAETPLVTPGPTRDAAIVLALAGTTLPFATSLQDEAERWLRVLRLHGRVGAAIQALGVAEAPLETRAEPNDPPAQSSRSRDEAIGMVASRASRLARTRGASKTSTLEVLFAVIEVYGRAFDRALYERGATREELLARVASTADAQSVA